MSWDAAGFCSRCAEHLNACQCPGAERERRRRAAASGADASNDAVSCVRTARTAPGISHTYNTTNRDLNQEGGERPDLLDVIRGGTWLNAQRFPQLRYAVPGLVPEGFTLLVGPPKAGKSWLALDWLLAIAAGGRALGAIDCTKPRGVLNCAFEDGDRRMQERCRALMGRDPIPGAYSYLTRVLHNRVADTLGEYLGAYPDTGVIALDTLGRVMPPARTGETTYGRDYRVGAAIKGVADSRPGLAVIAVHHDRKATAEDFVDSVSGTNGLAGSADTIIVLSRKRQSREALLQVTGRDVAEGEYALRLTDGTWTLDGGDLAEAAAAARRRREDHELGDLSRQVLAFAAQHPEGFRARDAAAKFGPGAYEYLRRLTDSGRLDKLSRGFYVLPSGDTSQENR